MRQFYDIEYLWAGSHPESDYPTFWANITNDLDDHLQDVLPKDADGALIAGPVKYWPPTFKLRCNSKGKPVDVVGGPMLRRVVSDRVRTVVEDLAPGQAQFLPVSLIRSTRAVTTESFFVVNPLHEFDALDWANTRFRPWKEPGTRELLPGSPEPLLEPSRIPSSAHVFVLKWGPAATTISYDLRARLELAGVEGLGYRPLPQKE